MGSLTIAGLPGPIRSKKTQNSPYPVSDDIFHTNYNPACYSF